MKNFLPFRSGCWRFACFSTTETLTKSSFELLLDIKKLKITKAQISTTPNTKIISQTIYRELNKVIKVELAEGWECEKPEMDTDLL